MCGLLTWCNIEYIALWDYPGSGPDDLTFNQDEVILVRDANESEDWWFGTLESSKKTGYFPRNYVQLKPEGIEFTQKKDLISYTNDTLIYSRTRIEH